MKKTSLILLLMGATVIIGNMAMSPRTYTQEELMSIHKDLFPVRQLLDSGEFFLNSENCHSCHGYDPLGYAMVDGAGNDVNLFDDWATSMMGLSAKDPLWRAKVSHESLVNPGHATELQNTCTKCHAPQGHYTAFFKGLPHYTIADLVGDSLGLDGVACSGCHMIGPNVGNSFSGNIPFDPNNTDLIDTNNVEYGPFQNPNVGPMDLYVNISPTYSPHVSHGSFCSPCHTLITNTVDLAGNFTGGQFIEQATYHEWLNSSYPGQNVSCQTCHMPQIEDLVILHTGGHIGATPRSPFNLHTFAGGNFFMLNLIKNYKDTLGIARVDSLFDNSISATTDLLRTQTLDLNFIGSPYSNQDTLFIDLELRNKAGHKFPSGYPSRRAVVQLVVIDQLNDTLFQSGTFNNDGEVKGLTASWLPHYQKISSESQVQIYEMIMGDVNGNRTTVLERAAVALKDNRIPPQGFTIFHSSYDTVSIEGNAAIDPDFNRNGVNQGTGKDLVHYSIPLNGYQGDVNIYARVMYQTVPPAWLTEMFGYSSPEIDLFEWMYNSQDKAPFEIASDSLVNFTLGGVSSKFNNEIQLFPNPSSSGVIEITSKDVIKNVSILDISGRQYPAPMQKNGRTISLQLPEKKGTYILILETKKGVIKRPVVRI